MIVTVVCDVLGHENNGTTIAAMNLIRFLKSNGVEVRVLCADQDKKNEDGYFVVPNLSVGVFNDYVRRVGVTLAKPDESVIRQALTGADVVHIMVPLALGLRVCKVAREMNIPITAGFHMQAENLSSHLKADKISLFNHYVYKFIYKHLYKYADAIHYPTEFIRQVFEKNIHKATPAYVISNGVSSEVTKCEVARPVEYADKVVILSIGRLGGEKSHDTLLRAVRLSRHSENIKVIIAGTGPLEGKLKKLAQHLPVSATFGYFERKEIVDMLNYCDMYVHPAHIELEGIACLEAVCCGKLIIVSNSKKSATSKFAVDSKCLFKSRNAKDLASKIDYWIEHPEEKKICEEKTLLHAGEYNRQRCMEKMLGMIIDAKDGRSVSNFKKEQVKK